MVVVVEERSSIVGGIKPEEFESTFRLMSFLVIEILETVEPLMPLTPDIAEYASLIYLATQQSTATAHQTTATTTPAATATATATTPTPTPPTPPAAAAAAAAAAQGIRCGRLRQPAYGGGRVLSPSSRQLAPLYLSSSSSSSSSSCSSSVQVMGPWSPPSPANSVEEDEIVAQVQ